MAEKRFRDIEPQSLQPPNEGFSVSRGLQPDFKPPEQARDLIFFLNVDNELLSELN
jgi:hypothetical protein